MKTHQKVVICVAANTGREVLVLVDFQDKYYSVSYWIYILASIT